MLERNIEPADPVHDSEPVESKRRRTVPSVPKSLAWLVLFGVVFYGAAIIFGLIYGIYLRVMQPDHIAQGEVLRAVQTVLFSPTGIFFTSLIQFVLLLPLVILASHFRSQPWIETLAVRSVTLKVLGLWLLVYAGYFVLQAVMNLVLAPDMGEVMDTLSGTRHFGLAFAFVFVAPIIEELIFRGYLYTAWRQTRLGMWGTILLTSLLFSAVHGFQYPGILLGYLFVFSILLGLAREKTGSIWPPIAMHMTNNLIGAIGLLFLGMS